MEVAALPQFIVLFFVILMTSTIGVTVFVRNRDSFRHRVFVLFAISLSLWLAANFFVDEPISDLSMILSGYLDFALAPIMFVGLFLVARHIDEHKENKPFKTDYVITGLGVLFMIMVLFTNWIVAQVYITDDGISDIVLTEFSLTYDLFIFGTFFASAYFLIRWFIHGRGVERRQAGVVLLGILLTFSGIVFVNAILPDLVEYSKEFVLYTRMANLGFVLLVLALGFAILRHKLMNVRVLTAEMLVMGILILLLFDIVTAENIFEILLRGALILVALMVGWKLIGSVYREVQQRQEIERLAKQLRSANARLKKLDQAKTEFLSVASHELRTPLSVIRGYVSMLKDGSFGKYTKKQAGVMQKIETSTTQLIDLVNELLNVSRIESGRTTVELESMDVVKLAAETTDFLKVEAKRRGLLLTFEKPKTKLSNVVGDPDRVHEVLTNTIGNALKYTEKGFVHVIVKDDEGFVRVEIADSGVGLTKADLAKLFQKFSRAESAAVNHASGTGLGLYVTKRYIEAMGGKIWAESAGRGKGSTFIFTLPKASKALKKKTKVV